MAIELITNRSGQKGYDRMMEIWRLCEDRFGKPDYYKTWDGEFADDSDDWVAFKFWDESLAAYVKLMYPDLMTRDEFLCRDLTQD